MSELKKNFEKVGGWQLIKQYWKAGVLFYVLFQILLTGVSKKSLELVRLGVKLKIKNKLKRKYKYVIDDFDNEHKEDIEKTKSHERKIWMCWMQGLENAPELVRQCYKQIKKNITDREIVLITEENIDEYVSFPSYIQEKYKKGIISHTHFSDLLRIELLCKYGGTWIDSTVFCSGSTIPS
jgi:mannosyltransferase OCH1-like enzyme